jgi:PEP-CTERM motif
LLRFGLGIRRRKRHSDGSLEEEGNDLVTNDILAQAVLNFSYEVVGPLGSTAMVPLVFTGGVSLAASPAGSTFGTINVFNNTGLVATIHTCLHDLTCGSETAPTLTNYPFTIEANTVGGIGMEVYGIVEVNLSQGPIASGSFSATADPILAIDPAFLAANPGYTLVFSPGFVVSPSVPEPSTWAMLLVGFAGLGYAGWRRGRRAAAA